MAYLSDDRPEPFDRYNSFSREGNFKAYVVNLFIRMVSYMHPRSQGPYVPSCEVGLLDHGKVDQFYRFP